jgi:PAS domain S-box-containing protein
MDVVDVFEYADDRGMSANALLTLKAALVRGEDLLASLPIGVYTCDRNGFLVQYNRKAAELWGCSPVAGDSNSRYCGAFRRYAPETGEPLAESPMREVLRSGRPVRDREMIVERPDGSRVSILANVDPLFDDDGALIGGVNCFQDITALRRTAVQLLDQERWFRELLEALPAAVYTTDAKGKVTFYNRAAAELAGREPKIGEDEWCVSWRLYYPDGTPLPHDQCPMAQTLKRNEAIRGAEAIVERPDGTRIPMTPYPTPLRDSKGELIGAVNMLIDISERKNADARQKALINEVNHRVKNTLATVQALAGQTLRGSASKEMRDTFEARLLALSSVHDHLARQQWEWAELENILKDVFAPYRGERGDRIRLGGSAVRLPPKVALTLAMVLHELATNAAHFGALSSALGTLTVTWRESEAGGRRALHLEWQEDGGPRVTQPAIEGFGLKLLERGIGKELNGESLIAFDNGGVRCIIDIPLPGRC